MVVDGSFSGDGPLASGNFRNLNWLVDRACWITMTEEPNTEEIGVDAIRRAAQVVLVLERKHRVDAGSSYPAAAETEVGSTHERSSVREGQVDGAEVGASVLKRVAAVAAVYPADYMDADRELDREVVGELVRYLICTPKESFKAHITAWFNQPHQAFGCSDHAALPVPTLPRWQYLFFVAAIEVCMRGAEGALQWKHMARIGARPEPLKSSIRGMLGNFGIDLRHGLRDQARRSATSWCLPRTPERPRRLRSIGGGTMTATTEGGRVLEARTARRSTWKKLLVLGIAVLFALGVGELLSRALFDKKHGPFSHNPIIQKQAESDFPTFEPDPELGHHLKDGGFIGVYHGGLVSLKQILSDERRHGRRIVLNLGDSSTSGWDSDVVAENAGRVRRGEPLRSPFQSYKTYSDIMAKDPGLYVINAGIPGYTSLQGARYLRRLVDMFRRADMRIDVVTIYFGNNDSAWNGNIEDRYLLPSDGVQLQLRRTADQATKGFRVVTRISTEDYSAHLHEIVTTARAAGAQVILIEPVIPRNWPPGLRAKGLEDEAEMHMNTLAAGTKVGALLRQAQDFYRRGSDALSGGRLEDARALFDQARERDYLVPRIKAPHDEVLRDRAVRDSVPLISTRARIPLDDSAYFIDYCHPIEPANDLISAEVVSAIHKLEWDAASAPAR
jgi:lysophospholipase L1-like esterase